MEATGIRPLAVSARVDFDGALGRIRTYTKQGLKLLPLPLGYEGMAPVAGFEPATSRLTAARATFAPHRNGQGGRIRTDDFLRPRQVC